MWHVAYISEARLERDDLPATERATLENAVKKLEALGPLLPFPHSSDVRGAAGIRELRPRGGRCAWRPLYKRVDDRFVIGAIAPEGGQDPRGFAQACGRARQRFKELEGK